MYTTEHDIKKQNPSQHRFAVNVNQEKINSIGFTYK